MQSTKHMQYNIIKNSHSNRYKDTAVPTIYCYFNLILSVLLGQ